MKGEYLRQGGVRDVRSNVQPAHVPEPPELHLAGGYWSRPQVAVRTRVIERSARGVALNVSRTFLAWTPPSLVLV